MMAAFIPERPSVDVRDETLFLGELKSSLCQETDDGWLDLLLQNFLARAGHDESPTDSPTEPLIRGTGTCGL